MSAHPRESEREAALSALQALDPGTDRDTWVRTGMAAKAAGIGFDEFDAWSGGGENYSGTAETLVVWKSFRADGGIGAGTLFMLAKEAGWQEPTDTQRARRRPALVAVPTAPTWAPVPEDAPAPPAAHPKHGAPSATWTYRDDEGRTICLVCRFNTGAESKEFYPLTFDGKRWQWKAPKTPRPLYGLDRLAADPGATVIVCEGEKAADAARKLIPDAVAITSPSGASSANAADWSPLRGRRVIVWPDFDAPGKKYARAVVECASQAGAELLGLVNVRDLVGAQEPPKGWDAADALADGMAPRSTSKLPLSDAPRPGADAPAKAPGSAFAFVAVGDRLRAGLKPVQWLVRNYVEADSLALLFGDPGCGKSFAAIDLACCIATGTPWHGNKTTPGAVFYIAGEGQNGLLRRFKAWSQHNGIPLDDAPLYVGHRPAQLVDASAAAAVMTAVKQLQAEATQKPALIVVDTLARNFGGDENSQEDMGAFIANLDGFLRKSGEWDATVLIVHHSGHADKSRGRGSSALKGAMDAEYSLAKDDAGVVRMEATKMKDAEQPQPVAFKLESVELDGMTDDEGEPVTSAVLWSVAHVPPTRAGKTGRGKNQTQALSLLAALVDEQRARLESTGHDPNGARVKMDDWRDRLSRAGVDRRRFYDLRNSLKDSGRIVVEFGGYVRLADDECPL